MAFIIILLINVIQIAAWLISLALIVDIIISYFVSPYNSFRMALDRLIQPLLSPIRRVVPPLGGTLDLSPLVLLILVQVVESILISILRRFIF